MTTRDTWLGIARRAEAATGPDRELDALIEAAMGRCGDSELMFKVKHPHKNEFVGNEDGSVDFYAADDDGKLCRMARRAAAAYSGSLDAAMTVRPEGLVTNFGDDAGPCWANVWRDDGDYDGVPCLAHAATPALALLAACCRARAEMEAE